MDKNIKRWIISLFLNVILHKILVTSIPITLTFSLSIANETVSTGLSNESRQLKSEPYNEIDSMKIRYSDTIAPEDIRESGVHRKLRDTKISLTHFRPGQRVRQYDINIYFEGEKFSGRAIIDVQLETGTRHLPIIFHLEDLNIQKVMTGAFTDANAIDTEYDVYDSIIEIYQTSNASSCIVIIEYTGFLGNHFGLYETKNDEYSYIAMNLHPTNARRVFPCVDEPSEASVIRFTFNNVMYKNIVMNSASTENSQTQFQPLQGPSHLWGMVAHNFSNVFFPTQNVSLRGRQRTANQEDQAMNAINHFYHALNDWTSKPYLEIVHNQDGNMNIIALPDSDREWYALSTISIWEPFVFMEEIHSVRQRQLGFTKLAEEMARQWFGYVVYPENWRYQWIVSGLATYSAYEILKELQHSQGQTSLDVNTLFVTEVIQESLLRDAYISSQPLEPFENIYDEVAVRNHIKGLLKYKAPALFRMLRLVLGGSDNDLVKLAARMLLQSRSLQTVNSLNFYDAINYVRFINRNQFTGDIAAFLNPWVENTGYPAIFVSLYSFGIIFVQQERFAFSPTENINYMIPLTFTTSHFPNFSDDNIYPEFIMESVVTIQFTIDDDDWVLFNIQGQGYYRVNYDDVLWNRIIRAIDNPERREMIHPLNRATLVDDALNFARAGKLDYDTAFNVVMTMRHEIEYAVWKAYVRNMNFVRKRLEALVEEHKDLHEDIYLRMVARIIPTFEDEIGFYPETNIIEPAMISLTRGLVMDHACRANYKPCIKAAVHWFYYPDNTTVVNPNTPRDIRPAVYCTMARIGGSDILVALQERLKQEASLYERVVILESMGCSQDKNFINALLEETISADGPYSVEENVRIFKAIAESSYANANFALSFIVARTNEIKKMYGGPEKMQELIFALADNVVNAEMARVFSNWIYSENSNLEDSHHAAKRAAEQVLENLKWDSMHMDNVYKFLEKMIESTPYQSTI